MQDGTFAVAQFIAVPRDIQENVNRHVHFASIAADHGAQLVLFPELSLTGYERGLTRDDAILPHDEWLQPLHRVATERKVTVVVGAPVATEAGLCIGAYVFHPDGSLSSYEKQYLHGGEEVAFIPGAGGVIFTAGLASVGVAICADITHPEHAQAHAHQGASVYAASCFLTPSGYDADAVLLQRYASEHDMVVLMSNYGAAIEGWLSAGRSAIWSEQGTLLAVAPDSGEALVVGECRGGVWKAEVVLV